MNESTRPVGTIGPLALIAFSLPLFVWSAFNAGYFDRATQESFIVPLAVFFGAPIALIAVAWALYKGDTFLGAITGLFAGFWASYGMLLWLTERGVVEATTSSGDIRGMLYAAWAVAFGIIWLGSMRQHWAMSLIALGSGAMFVLLSVGQYATDNTSINIGGWIGLVTAGLGAYLALAELLNAEFERVVLPEDLATLTQIGQPRS